MNKKISILMVMSFALMAFIFMSTYAAAEDDYICGVYITGIGCPNCAHTDPVLLSQYTSEYDNLIIIEYEIYHKGEQNRDVSGEYFSQYITDTRPGVPFVVFSQDKKGLGKFEVIDSNEIIEEMDNNPCPMPDGSSSYFSDLDLNDVRGEVTIWSKGRAVVLSEGQKDSDTIKELVTSDDIDSVLSGISHQKIDPEPVPVSEDEFYYRNGAEIENAKIFWEQVDEPVLKEEDQDMTIPAILLVMIALAVLIVRTIVPERNEEDKSRKGKFTLKSRQKDYMLLLTAALLIISFFLTAQSVPQDFVENAGNYLPLPVFTVLIALIDGFNPCNLFVLTFLLGLLTSASHSRKRIYIIGYTFIFVVFLIYLVFMVFWLNIFKYIGFIDPLRIGIAILAIAAGAINIKELIFFRKGVTLMIQDQHKRPLMQRMEKMDHIIKKGTLPVLIASSAVLALFSSLVELPCTAGFPIIYTAILSGRFVESSMLYYMYLVLYNIIYVVPLIIIITVFGWTFRGKQINKRQMQYIKYIGGLIMIMLGIILLVNPALIGMGL